MAAHTDTPDYWLLAKYIELIETINLIKVIERIDLVTAITNIANIESVDLIDLITKIDEITTIKKIEAIRDVTFSPKTVIVNPSFEQGAVGWTLAVGASISTDLPHYGIYSLLLEQGGTVNQFFPVPINTDWVTEWALYLYSHHVNAILRVGFLFTDGTQSLHNLTNAMSLDWFRKTVTPTAGKYIEQISLSNVSVGDYDLKVDDLQTVF